MSYIIAILALAVLCAGWALVQKLSGVRYKGTGCVQCECGEDKAEGERTCKRQLAAESDDERDG